MAKRHLRLVTPAIVNRTVRPKRPPNSKLRTREYLTEAEVRRLMNAARKSRWGHRDATMVLVAYRHGLRASELVDLRWEQVDFRTATLHVRRVKQGTPNTHPILGDELRALRRLQRSPSPQRALRYFHASVCQRLSTAVVSSMMSMASAVGVRRY
jgi:integrase